MFCLQLIVIAPTLTSSLADSDGRQLQKQANYLNTIRREKVSLLNTTEILQ